MHSNILRTLSKLVAYLLKKQLETIFQYQNNKKKSRKHIDLQLNVIQLLIQSKTKIEIIYHYLFSIYIIQYKYT